MRKNTTISIAIAVNNEARNLGSCLAAVSPWVNEIVVVDGGSTDETLKIAKSFKAKIIKTDNPPIFHINKQKAIEACTGEWILQLDADEIISPQLCEEIRAVINKSDKHQFSAGYYLSRKNFFLGHWLRKGGQYPDYVIRLFQNGKGKFPCQSVHEQIEIEGQTGYLVNPLLHYPYKTMREYWIKAIRYSALVARELAANKTPINFITVINYLLIRPWATFINLYLRHLGFVDGLAGLIFAVFSALHHPLAFTQYFYGKSLD